jgi:hypothetical protein
MFAKRLPLLVAALLLGPGLLAGTASAHHDGLGELPDLNPHAFGIPQELWDDGVEQVVDGQAPVVLSGEGLILDVPDDFWTLFRVGGDDGFYLGLRLVHGLAVGEVLLPDELHALLDDGEVELVNVDTGAPVEFGVWDYLLVYPHPHYLLLHAGTPRERCQDLSSGQLLASANYHNAVHIGAPGGHAFLNAGHEIHAGTCESAGF